MSSIFQQGRHLGEQRAFIPPDFNRENVANVCVFKFIVFCIGTLEILPALQSKVLPPPPSGNNKMTALSFKLDLALALESAPTVVMEMTEHLPASPVMHDSVWTCAVDGWRHVTNNGRLIGQRLVKSSFLLDAIFNGFVYIL